MLNRLVLFPGIAALVLTAASAQAAYIETFDSTNANWKYGYGTNFSSPENSATWTPAEGNAGGYISGPAVNGKGLYAIWTYDTAVYGDMNGLTMTIDTKVEGHPSGTAQFYVGRGGTYFVDGQWSIGADTSWTTHTTALNTTEFSYWNWSANSTYSLEQVLAAPDDIGIFFGGSLVSGSGNVMVDNFGTVVPVPAAAWLFGSGLLGLAGVARRKAD